jgi:hypothetical protein
MSGETCRHTSDFKPAPGIRPLVRRLLSPCARVRSGGRAGSESRSVRASTCRCARGHPLYPRGPWLRASSVVSLPHGLIRPHPSVPPARGDFTAEPLIRRVFAVRERLGDPRDLPYFSYRSVCTCRRPYAGGSAASSRYHWRSDTRLPRFSSESPPTTTVSASNARRVINFGAATFALCCGPYVCQALLTGYDLMEPRALRPAF